MDGRCWINAAQGNLAGIALAKDSGVHSEKAKNPSASGCASALNRRRKRLAMATPRAACGKGPGFFAYEKSWSDSLINSSAFQNLEGNQHPAAMPVESTEFIASAIILVVRKKSHRAPCRQRVTMRGMSRARRALPAVADFA